MLSLKQIIFIKLGGSVITDKKKNSICKEKILTRLVKEICLVKQLDQKNIYLIGHGSGSFAHYPAVKYSVISGFKKNQSRMGMAITQDKAAELNRLVVKSFLAENIPAVSYAFCNNLVTNKSKKASWQNKVLLEYLKKDLTVVTYGDVLADQTQGCTIWSTEIIFNFLARELMRKKFKINKIIHVTQELGFLDKQGKLIEQVSLKSWPKLKANLFTTSGIDTTGGMAHKLEQSLQLTKVGIESVILSGLKKNNLFNCLIGKNYVGTKIF